MSITRKTFDGIADHTLIVTFAAADCQHLAAALVAQYDVDMVFVGADDGSWIHALVHDRGSDMYLDITGVKTLDEVQAEWADWDGWDAIYPASEATWDRQTRAYPEVPISAGIEMVLYHAAIAGVSLNSR